MYDHGFIQGEGNSHIKKTLLFLILGVKIACEPAHIWGTRASGKGQRAIIESDPPDFAPPDRFRFSLFALCRSCVCPKCEPARRLGLKWRFWYVIGS